MLENDQANSTFAFITCCQHYDYKSIINNNNNNTVWQHHDSAKISSFVQYSVILYVMDSYCRNLTVRRCTVCIQQWHTVQQGTCVCYLLYYCGYTLYTYSTIQSVCRCGTVTVQYVYTVLYIQCTQCTVHCTSTVLHENHP